MVHLGFLVASLGLVLVGQKLMLAVLPRLEGWWLRRCLQLLGLFMPLSVITLFALTMLPVMLMPETNHNLDPALHRDWLVAVIGFSFFSLPVAAALLWNIVRLAWLYGRTYRRTWLAPTGLAELSSQAGQEEALAELTSAYATRKANQPALTAFGTSPSTRATRPPEAGSGPGSFKLQPAVRLWHSSRSFAFNLPGMWPGARPLIIISTAMVEKLGLEELQAVIWHECAHLARRDFWIIWLASWWRNAFWYLPAGRRYFKLLQDEQELACDDRVVRQGGVPVALALAQALLQIWEETLAGAGPAGGGSMSARRGIFDLFEAPGLAGHSAAGMPLTELRVNRLIELGEGVRDALPEGKTLTRRLQVGGLLSGGVGLWLAGLEIMHMVMLPLGCAISLGFI